MKEKRGAGDRWKAIEQRKSQSSNYAGTERPDGRPSLTTNLRHFLARN
jgi:hypothetical protein